MKFKTAQFIQSVLNRVGFQIRRIEPGVSYGDPLSEMARLAGKEVRRIVEVGAADGRDTLKFIAAFPNAQVVAFEPLPQNFAKLAACTSGEERVVAINAAVSDESGRKPLYVTSLADASSLLKPQATGATFDVYTNLASEITVDCVRLNDGLSMSEGEFIDILKLDVQGAELQVMIGAEELLQQKRVRVIYSEVNFVRMYKGATLYHELASHMAARGYRLHNLYNLVHNQKGELAWGDAMFVPSS